MDSTVATGSEENVWGGGNRPLGASYGKLMMWFFLVSDALTFSGLLAAYGFSRFKFIETWPIADQVFTHVPFVHGNFPMIYVAFMTLILIISSVTMVLAVDAGHRMKKNAVIWYMFLTIIGGAIFALFAAIDDVPSEAVTKEIIITDQMADQIAARFERGRRRRPTARELAGPVVESTRCPALEGPALLPDA